MRLTQIVMLILGLCSLQTFATPTAAPASADSAGELRIAADAVKETKNKVDGDIDQEITNPKIRADSGSKSKFSASTTLSYKGGAISRPFGAERPDLSGLPENQLDSSVDGAVKVRYRSTTHSSYTAGVALGLKTPFQGDVNDKNNQLNVGDPLLGYNYTFAALGLQNSWNITSSGGTSQESLRVDQVASIATDITLMKKVDKLSFGVSTSAWHNFYSTEPGDNSKTKINSTAGHSLDKRTGSAVTFFPTVEYYVTDKIAFRTLFGYFKWRHLYGDRDNWSLLPSKEYQSVGLGLTLTRDIYLYPNVQFLPRDIRSAYTNFGVSATINVF